jgi:hypothetical protein
MKCASAPKSVFFSLVRTSLVAVVHEVCICPKKCIFRSYDQSRGNGI